MPEIAAMGAVERLDMMLNDSMHGILVPGHQQVPHLCQTQKVQLHGMDQRLRGRHDQHRRGQLPDDE
ncbi:hypothetical protein MASR2M48_04330 [Spirochaetota bacterium]